MANAIGPTGRSGSGGVSLDALDGLPMRRRQFLIVALILLVAILDGYDALSMALVAPAVSQEFGIDKAMLGLLLSSSLLGMAIGSILLSPFADRVGRRPLVLGGLAVMTLGAFVTGLAPDAVLMAIGRLVTGMGIGVMIPMTTLCVAEFSNGRLRPLLVAAIATVGFPVGGIAGGILASVLLPTLGWHWVFLIGAIAGAVLLIPVALFLPESPSYLAAAGATDALQKTNRVLQRLGHSVLQALPATPEKRPSRSYGALFSKELAGTTARLITINLLVATATFYIVNWLPQQIADAGFSPATGSLVSASSHAVGLLGGLVMGAIATRFAPTRLAGLTMIGCAGALAVLGLAPPVLPVIIAAACAYGFFGVACTGLLYGILAVSFPSLHRASGLGLVMGVGRAASAIGPALAGWMFATGISPSFVSLIFACGPLLAALLIWNLPRATARARRERSGDTASHPGAI